MSPGDESATTFVCVCVFPCSETIISDEFEWVRESVFFSFLFPFLSVSFRFCFNKVECEKRKWFETAFCWRCRLLPPFPLLVPRDWSRSGQPAQAN